MMDGSFAAPPPVLSLYDEDAVDGDTSRLDESGRFKSFADLTPGNEDLAAYARNHVWDGDEGAENDDGGEESARFYLDEIDERFNAVDEARSGYAGTQARGDAFARFSRSGFRGHVGNRSAAETSPARVLEAANALGSAERPEEVEFARAVEGHMQGDVFALLHHFGAVCSARVADLRPLVEASVAEVKVAGSLEAMRAYRDYGFLKSERDTWLLISALYKDRLLGAAASSSFAADHAIIEDRKEQLRALTTSQKQIKQELKDKNRMFRELRIVVKWLEQLAKLEDVPTYRIDAGWSNTLRVLQTESAQGRRGPFHSELVSSLDPDAPARQDKKLQEEDEEDQERLLQVVWSLLRAGAKKEALDFCSQSGQSWRAASLGATLSSEPLLLIDDGTKNVYQLWQLACRSISEQVERYNEYERAIYATMCGNVEQILPVCRTWEDNVWANFKGLLHDLLDVELQLRNPRSSTTIEPPTEEQIVYRVTQIFDQMLKSDTWGLRQAVNDAHHIVQTHLILNTEDRLLDDLAAWVSPKESASCSPVLIRFAAHLGLFLRHIYGTCPRADELVEAYVKHLIKTRQTALVALYTAKLPAEEQVEIYASFLCDINQREERERCLELADRAGLNVNAITKRVVELIRGASPGAVTGSSFGLVAGMGEEAPLVAEGGLHKPAGETTPEDEAGIRAIEWLTFDPDQRIDALIHANALARKFIAADKYNALNRLLNSLPRDSVNVVKRRWVVKKTAGEENVVREYACYEYLRGARAAYDAWATHGTRQPAALEAPPAISALASTQIGYRNREKAYAEEVRRWQADACSLAGAAMHALYALLLFPNGWLQDLDTSRPSPDAQALNRARQMDELRRKVLPEIFVLGHQVLFESKQYQDSVELADLLADEYHKFYLSFTKEQLQQFLALVRKSALQLLDEHHDVLAY